MPISISLAWPSNAAPTRATPLSPPPPLPSRSRAGTSPTGATLGVTGHLDVGRRRLSAQSHSATSGRDDCRQRQRRFLDLPNVLNTAAGDHAPRGRPHARLRRRRRVGGDTPAPLDAEACRGGVEHERPRFRRRPAPPPVRKEEVGGGGGETSCDALWNSWNVEIRGGGGEGATLEKTLPQGGAKAEVDCGAEGSSSPSPSVTRLALLLYCCNISLVA